MPPGGRHACAKCGSAEHSTKKCTSTIELRNLCICDTVEGLESCGLYITQQRWKKGYRINKDCGHFKAEAPSLMELIGTSCGGTLRPIPIKPPMKVHSGTGETRDRLTPPPRPALPPSRIFERLRAGAAERFALREKLIADGVPMASVEEQVSALYQRQKAAAEVAEAPAPDDLQAAVVPDGAAGVAPARLVAASTAPRTAPQPQSAPPPPRPPAPRTAPHNGNVIDLTLADSEDRSDPPTPPGDDGYSSSSSDCSVESIGGQYVPQPPGPAPPNRTWDTRRGAWVDVAGEFEAWLARNVPVARRAQLRAAADSLADLRCCDIDELDDALELSQWSEPERQRFMDACSSL